MKHVEAPITVSHADGSKPMNHSGSTQTAWETGDINDQMKTLGRVLTLLKGDLPTRCPLQSLQKLCYSDLGRWEGFSL